MKISQTISPLEFVAEDGDENEEGDEINGQLGDESDEHEDTNGEIDDENVENGQDGLKLNLKINENMQYMNTRGATAFMDNVDMMMVNGSQVQSELSNSDSKPAALDSLSLNEKLGEEQQDQNPKIGWQWARRCSMTTSLW